MAQSAAPVAKMAEARARMYPPDDGSGRTVRAPRPALQWQRRSSVLQRDVGLFDDTLELRPVGHVERLELGRTRDHRGHAEIGEDGRDIGIGQRDLRFL